VRDPCTFSPSVTFATGARDHGRVSGQDLLQAVQTLIDLDERNRAEQGAAQLPDELPVADLLRAADGAQRLARALAGAVIAVASLVALRDPLQRGGDLGAQADLSGPLVAALAIGVLLVLAGAATATALVRAQLRRHDTGRSGRPARGGRIVP